MCSSDLYNLIKIKNNVSDKQIVESFKKVLIHVLNDLNIEKNTQLIVNLSGGYDSRLIVASIVKFLGIRPVTYTSEKYPADFEEVTKARDIAETVKCKNIYVKLERNLFRKYLDKKLSLVDYQTNYHLWLMPLIKKYKNKDMTNIDGFLGDVILGDTYLTMANTEEHYNKLVLINGLIIKIFSNTALKKIKKISRQNFMNERKLYENTNNQRFFFDLNNRAKN